MTAEPEEVVVDEKPKLGDEFGSRGHLDYLRERNPVPFFDDHVEFYEYLVIDSVTRKKVDYPPINHDTGECDRTLLRPGTEVAEHKYFVDGEPQQGSATGYVHRFFPEFQAQSEADRIGSSARLWTDPEYPKYYRFGEADMRTVWGLARGIIDEAELDQEFAALRQCLSDRMHGLDATPHEGHWMCGLFARLHPRVASDAILAWWKQMSDESLALGREMHRSIEMCYNNMYYKDDARFKTVSMEQFTNFHFGWVIPNGLTMFRTELSLRHQPVPGVKKYLNGTIDAVFLDKDGNVWLVDWKRSKEIKSRPFRKSDTGSGPCAGLGNCNREHYNMQLNVYRYIVEQNTSFKVVRCYIAVFHPNQTDYVLYPVPDYQDRVRKAMSMFALSLERSYDHGHSGAHAKN